MNVTKPSALLQCKKFQNVKFLGILNQNYFILIEHGPHWINFIILTFINENTIYSKCLYNNLKQNYFIWHEEKKREI